MLNKQKQGANSSTTLLFGVACCCPNQKTKNAKLPHSPGHARGGHGRGGVVCERDDPWSDGRDGSGGGGGCRRDRCFEFDIDVDVDDGVDDVNVGGGAISVDSFAFFRLVRRRRPCAAPPPQATPPAQCALEPRGRRRRRRRRRRLLLRNQRARRGGTMDGTNDVDDVVVTSSSSFRCSSCSSTEQPKLPRPLRQGRRRGPRPRPLEGHRAPPGPARGSRGRLGLRRRGVAL